MDAQIVLAVIGGLLLGLGVFLPIINIPMAGAVNYFNNGSGDGVVVLVVALVSLGLAVRRHFHWLWTAGIGTVLFLAGTLIRLEEKLIEARHSLDIEMAGNPFKGMAELAANAIQIQWGWAVLFLGAGCLIAAAAMRKSRAATKKCSHCAELIQPEANVCKHCGLAVEPEPAPLLPPRMPRRVLVTTILLAVAVVATWVMPILRILLYKDIL